MWFRPRLNALNPLEEQGGRPCRWPERPHSGGMFFAAAIGPGTQGPRKGSKHGDATGTTSCQPHNPTIHPTLPSDRNPTSHHAPRRAQSRNTRPISPAPHHPRQRPHSPGFFASRPPNRLPSPKRPTRQQPSPKPLRTRLTKPPNQRYNHRVQKPDRPAIPRTPRRSHPRGAEP